MFHMRWGEVVDACKGPAVIGNDQHKDHDETGSNELSDFEHLSHEHGDKNNTDKTPHKNHDNKSDAHYQQVEPPHL